MSRALLYLPLLALCLWAAPAQAQLKPRPELEGGKEARGQRVFDLLGPEHIVREAWRETGRYFFDKRLLGSKDWQGALERALVAARAAQRPADAHAAINGMLAELGVSHLVLLEHDVWARELAVEFSNTQSVRAGCELVELQGRYFASGVVPGGPAARSGLLEGDEVLSVDGVQPAQSPVLVDGGHDPGLSGPHGSSLRVREGQDLRLQVRREEGGALREVILRPARDSLIEAARRSVRVETIKGQAVGVVALPHYIHPEMVRILRDALRGPLKDAAALVLDVRGRGGMSTVVRAILNLFRGPRALWTKPVVLLTDGGTRSAKEIFAFHWKRQNLGPIVGERTQGACIGCRFVELSDGSVLCVPVSDVRRLSGGETLEGKGVEPTLRVRQLPLPYRAGRDRILEAGLRHAGELARGAVPQPL